MRTLPILAPCGPVNSLSGTNLAFLETQSMQEKFSVAHPLVGTVHIDHITGALSWGQDNLDPLIKRYVKRYLFDEGFIEQALGMLDPVIDQDITALLEILRDSDF
jgi:hypothetical protein